MDRDARANRRAGLSLLVRPKAAHARDQPSEQRIDCAIRRDRGLHVFAPRPPATWAGVRGIFGRLSLRTTSIFSDGDAITRNEMTWHHDRNSPLANNPVPRTPACLQAGSRDEREAVYFLKDTWRGRRDSNPPPRKLRRDLAEACARLLRGMRRRTRGLRRDSP